MEIYLSSNHRSGCLEEVRDDFVDKLKPQTAHLSRSLLVYDVSRVGTLTTVCVRCLSLGAVSVAHDD